MSRILFNFASLNIALTFNWNYSVMNQFIDFDEKLYAGLRQGDEAAFTVVFERYNRLLYALAYRYLKSGEEAEDAVQYTFMKVWGQRDSFDFRSGIRSLLFTILKNYIPWKKHLLCVKGENIITFLSMYPLI